jgi:hypothetical protein
VRRLVATLDIPVHQVLIEARIVIVANDFKRELGAIIGVTNWQKSGQNGLVYTTGTAAGLDQQQSTFITGQNAINNAINAGTTPVPLPTYGIPSATNRYNVNLPVSNPARHGPRRARRQRRQRGGGFRRRERPLDQHPRDRDAGAGERWADGSARRHPRDDAARG